MVGTRLITAEAQLCRKDALVQTLQVNERTLGLRNVVVGNKSLLNVAQLAGSRPISKTVKRTGLHAIRCDKY